MYVRLKDKPYYFLTDRDTKYTFLITNPSDGQESTTGTLPSSIANSSGDSPRSRMVSPRASEHD